MIFSNQLTSVLPVSPPASEPTTSVLRNVMTVNGVITPKKTSGLLRNLYPWPDDTPPGSEVILYDNDGNIVRQLILQAPHSGSSLGFIGISNTTQFTQAAAVVAVGSAILAGGAILAAPYLGAASAIEVSSVGALGATGTSVGAGAGATIGGAAGSGAGAGGTGFLATAGKALTATSTAVKTAGTVAGVAKMASNMGKTAVEKPQVEQQQSQQGPQEKQLGFFYMLGAYVRMVMARPKTA